MQHFVKVFSYLVLIFTVLRGPTISYGMEPATPSQPVPRNFFGMHVHRANDPTHWPSVSMPSWRLWDASVAWPNLEPHKDQWSFKTLDEYVALAQEHHSALLLPLALSPAWASARPLEPSVYQPGFAAEPRDIEDWRTFVRMVAIRYKGRIQAYEIWNEPNSKYFWTGSLDQMLVLTREASRIIRSIDPEALIVSPAATNRDGIAWLSEFLSKGGGQYVDVIGFHFYVAPHPPEAITAVARQIREILLRYGVVDKPLWNTETGWPYPKPFPSDTLGAAYLARAYILSWVSGVTRFYWYSWDNHNWVSLETTDKDSSTLKPAGKAYEVIQMWLEGAKVNNCSQDSARTWLCSLNHSGTIQHIGWNPEKQVKFEIPASWHATEVTPLLGDTRRNKDSRITLGPLPTLIAADTAH